MRTITTRTLACAIAAAANVAHSQETNSDKYVSKEEYLKLKAEHDQLKQQLETMQRQMEDVKQMAKESFPGSTKMLIGGYGSATFTSTTSGYGPATPLPPDSRGGRNFFTATFNPILLWKMSDRLLFAGE